MATAGTGRRASWAVFNQTYSPSFQHLIEELSASLGPCFVFTGTPFPSATDLVEVSKAPSYRRGSLRVRAVAWLKYVVKAAFQMARLPRGTKILVVTNPPMLPHLAWLFSRLKGHRYAILVWDIYPDLLIASGMTSRRNPVARLWLALNRRALGRADAVITIGARMADRIRAQLRTPRSIEVIPNWADTSEIRPLPKADNAFAREHGQTEKVTVLYAGNVGANHGIERLVEAAHELETDDRLSFMIVGDGLGMERVRAEMDRLKPSNLTILDPQPWESVPLVLATGDIAVVSQERGTEHLSMPSKSYTSLAAGSAILALTSQGSDLADLVEDGKVGEVCSEASPAAIAEAVRRLAADGDELERRRSTARAEAERTFSEQVVFARWREVLETEWAPGRGGPVLSTAAGEAGGER